MRAFLTLFLLAVITTGCRRTVVHTSASASTGPDTLITGTVIQSAGSWTASTLKGSTKLEISVSGNSFNWTITSEQNGGEFGTRSTSGMGLLSPTDPWFVFVESPSRLWMCNGTNELSYKFENPGGEGSGGFCIYDGKLQSDGPPIPSGLVPHLPPDLRKLFPNVEPAGTRPSI